MKKYIFSVCVLFFAGLTAKTQVITASPSLPTDLDSVTIIFNASLGNKGLQDYVGDVYAHTGVITDKSTTLGDWKYVKSNWGVNTPACKLTRIDANHYSLSIKPSIRSYYGVSSTDTIKKLAFVFRSASPYTGTSYHEGKETGNADIFYSVYKTGLNVTFIEPANSFSIDSSGQEIPVLVNASNSDSIALYHNNILVKSSNTSSLNYSLIAAGSKLNILVARAYKNEAISTDTAWYLVKGSTLTEALPPDVKDGINYINDSTVTFVLYAPYKNNVYLIGEFNNWLPDSIYQFKKDGERFWLSLSGFKPMMEYGFQYLIDGIIKIADPYSDKVLDPWNDKYISSSIYPGLKSYPSSKTTEITGVIQTGQAEYNWEVNNFTAPAKQNLVIYELLIRDFTNNRDISSVMDSIPYLKRLGINAIELMPFNEFEGNDSWGYNPDFYFATDKAYGTKNDYKKFIDECHKNGIAVIQDMVLNHSYGQSPLVRMYFDGTNPSVQNPWYNVTSPNTTYSWGYDFNHQSSATQYFVDRVTSYWLSEYKVDGFRFDFTKGFTNTPGDGSAYDGQRIGILKRMANAIWSVNPNAYVILEHLAGNTEEKELASFGMMLWGNLNCAFSQAAIGFPTGSCSWDFGWTSYLNRGWTNSNLVAYMESHDEERLMFKNLMYGNNSGGYNIKDLFTAVRRMELTSCFFYSIPGPKMLLQFGELGYDVSIETGGRTAIKPTHWEYYQDEYRHQLYDVTAALIRLKETEPVFSTSTFTLDVTNTVKQITLTDSNTEVHIIGNFGVTTNPISLHFTNTGKWYNYFRGDSMNVAVNDTSFNLPAGEFRIYSNRDLSGFGSLVFTGFQKITENNLLNIYPNPVSDILSVDYPAQNASIEIISIDGKIIKEEKLPQDRQIDVSMIEKGIYLVHLYSPNGQSSYRHMVKL